MIVNVILVELSAVLDVSKIMKNIIVKIVLKYRVLIVFHVVIWALINIHIWHLSLYIWFPGGIVFNRDLLRNFFHALNLNLNLSPSFWGGCCFVSINSDVINLVDTRFAYTNLLPGWFCQCKIKNSLHAI